MEQSLFKKSLFAKVRAAAEYTVVNKTTVRATAKALGMNKSTVHNYLAKRLPEVSPDLTEKVRAVLNVNFEERAHRGGIALREKYKKKLVK